MYPYTGALMKTWLFRTLATLCTVLASLSLVFAQQSHTLVYKFEQGKTYQYKSVSEGTIIQEMMGQEMKIENGSDLTVSLMTDMIGKRMKIQVKTDGTVLGREIIDTVESANRMRGVGQREALRFHILPKKTVGTGDTWASSFVDTVDNMGGKIVNSVQNSYTVIGRETKNGADCLKVEYTGEIMIEGSGTMQGMDIYIEGAGAVKGTMYFEPAKGMVVQDESTTETESTIAVTGQQNMTIPLSQMSTTVQTLLP
jgi:hypothetical protein